MNHLSMLWSSFNQFLNQNEGADYAVTGSAIIGGYTIHFAEFDSLLKTSLTMLSIVFVAYRIHSHHQDRMALKKDKNSKRVDAE
jgi:hypothetical protein